MAKTQKIGKADMAHHLAEDLGITNREATLALETVMKLVRGYLHGGFVVALSDIGTMTPVTRRQRTGRNPKTGETMIIPEGRAVKFKLSPKLFG